MPSRRSAAFAAVLLAAWPGLAAAYDSLVIPVRYADDAERPAAGVALAPAPPLSITFPPGSAPAPAQIAPGAVNFYSYFYSVQSGLPAGTIPVPFSYSPSGGLWERREEEDLVVDIPVGAEEDGPSDRTPPVTARTISGPWAQGPAEVILSSLALVGFSPSDPLVGGEPTSQVAGTWFFLDAPFVDTATTPGVPWASTPFVLAPGSHTLSWYSADLAGNLEIPRFSAIVVDDSPPAPGGFFPTSAEVFGSVRSSFTVAWSLLDDADPSPVASARLLQVEDTGSVNAGSSIVVVALGQLVLADALDDGLWALEINATDWVQNSTRAVSAPFQIVHAADSMPPVTQLTLGPPSVLGDPSFVSSSTLITLAATDDLSSVASLTYAIDGSTMVVSGSSVSFSLAQEGVRTVAFSAADAAGNVEAVQVASVTVDATPPVLSFSLSGSSLTDRLGRVVISSSTQLLLFASDALSGVGALAYSLDGGPVVSLAVSSIAVSFSDEGLHSVFAYTQDRVENRSLSFTTSVIVDVSPPSFGVLSVAGGDGSSGSESAAISTTSASAQIPLSDLASGLDVTGAGSGPSPLSAIPGTLGLWHFDEPSGTTALNSGPAGNGTLNANVSRRTGILGGAVQIGPNPNSTPNAGVTLAPAAYSVINNMPAGTIELWAKLEQESTVTNMRHVFTLKQHNGVNTMFQFAIQQGATNELWHASNGLDCNTLIQVDPTRWAHFAVTWDSQAAKLYKDGALIRTCNGSFPVPNDTSPTCLSIAGACGDLTMNGSRLIDEVRVLNRALSGAEIAQDALDQAKPFAARLSTDGGLNFSDLASVDFPGADGGTSGVLSASGLLLKASTSPADATNMLEFTARDLAGHVGSVRKVVLVNLNKAREPALLSPADQFSSSAPLVAFSWAPGLGVPAASITGYELQYARDAAFSQDLVTLSPSTNSVSVPLPEGAFHWRVAAFDRFGDKSPYSEPRRVFVDSQPPAFADAAVSTAPGAAFRSAALPVNSLSLSARASVRDLASGLRITPVAGGPTPLTPVTGTLGLWHFDEPSGTAALNAGPAGNGTLNPNVSREAGILGGAVRVGPNPASTPNSGVTLAPAAYSVINSMAAGTIELWAKLEQDSTVTNMRHVFTLKQHNGANTEFEFSVSNTTNELWHASNGLDCNTPIQVDPTRWAHFAVTWDSTAAKLYKDGALIRTCAGSFPVPNDLSPTCLSIAGACGDLTMNGSRLIDEVRVLNRALSSAEVAQDAAVAQAAAAFSAALSTDGGATFRALDAASVSLTGVDGTTSTETLTAQGLALVESASLERPLNIVRFFTADLAGRATDFYFSVLADTTPPSVAVSSPLAGSVFSGLPGAFTPSVNASDRLDPSPSITAELVQLTDEGGNGLLDQVAVSTGLPFDTSLIDGAWALMATAVDFAGNASSATSGAFRIERDLLAPRTSLVVDGPQLPGTPVCITPQTALSLSATDDLLLAGDGAGVGVAGSSYTTGVSALFENYAGSFTLVEGGPYDLRYFSTDKAGHSEGVRLASVAVDGTGPAVALGFQAPFRVVPGTDTVFVAGLGPLFVSATDYPALAVGTTAVYLSVDGQAAAPASTTAFFLAQGLRSLEFWAVDALGNQGSTISASLKLDTTPPAAVVDLALAALSSTAVGVSWTATGDDEAAGDVFDAAVRLDFGPDPGNLTQGLVLSSGALAVGARFAQTFSGLASGTTYYAAVYARDSAGNWSSASNAAAVRTFSVAVSADNVASLASPVPAEVAVVSTVTQAQAYTVAIASQGLAPAGSFFYEITSGLVFSTEAPAVISFTFDPALVDPDSVRIFTYDAAGLAWSSASIFNQTLTMLAPDEYRISGEILHTSLYAPMVTDTVAPLTAFSLSGSSAVLEGSLFAGKGSSGVLTAQDFAPPGGAPWGLAGTLIKVGQGQETTYIAPFALPVGAVSIEYRSLDKGGNSEEPKTAQVFVDAAGPILTASANTEAGTLSVMAEDAGAGLGSFSVLLDGEPVLVEFVAGAVSVSTSFALSPGAHVLHATAADRLGQASFLDRTFASDVVPPAVAFSFPRPEEPGLCRLAQGQVSVRGKVADANLASWSLREGAALLGSGSASVDGLLGTWDAKGKAGPFNLTLSAIDAAGQTASTSLALFAGQPSRTLALGGKKALNKPRGVAWGPNRVYVADTNSDLVRVYDAAGNLLSSFGDKRRALKLNKPSGLAVDSSGNIFVADAGNKRVVKLSPAGVLLKEFGGKRILEKPVAVALSGGNILAADSHAGEVVVFSEAGILLRRLALPVLPGGRHDDDEHDDEDEDEARPMALAAEASGAFWVADSKGGRVLRYSADFNLLQTIPGFARPEGLAVSPSGACLAVVDSKAGRVRTFDAALGAELAAFGKDSLHRPAQAVFTSDGQLLVANRNEDQVTGFGLPGTPIIIAMTQPKGGFRLSSDEDNPMGEPVIARVGRVEGGFVEEPGGASVEVPAGAVSQDLDISVAVAPEAGVAERTSQNLVPASSPRQFGPHGHAFSAPVTITLPYDPRLAFGVATEDLRIHYWNAERGTWEALASRVDADAHTISAETLHFSLYQVLAPARTASLMADPEATFALRSVYAFPNPAVGGQKPTIHVAVGKADRVTIRIYDIAGTPVHETTMDGSPSVVNDDTGAHFAYEYSWAGHIPSGVYLYTITAEKAGNAPIKRVGKLAVVR